MTTKNKDIKDEIKPVVNAIGGLFIGSMVLVILGVEIDEGIWTLFGGLELFAIVWALMIVNRK